MALSREDLLERRNFIGSSDIPAILGVDEYRNIHDVWLEKTGRLEIDESTNAAADLGNRLEPVLVQWVFDAALEQNLGLQVEIGWSTIHAEHDFLRSQHDGMVVSAKNYEAEATIEAKSHGLFNPMFDASEWGDNGSNHIPYKTLAQTQFSLLCSGLDTCYVGALLGAGVGLRWYVVNRHEALIKEIEARALEFWKSVKTDTPPSVKPSLYSLERMVRQVGKYVEIDEEYPDRWQALNDQGSLINAAKKDLKAEILLAIGDAERGVTPFGEFTTKDSKGNNRFTLRGYNA